MSLVFHTASEPLWRPTDGAPSAETLIPVLDALEREFDKGDEGEPCLSIRAQAINMERLTQFCNPTSNASFDCLPGVL